MNIIIETLTKSYPSLFFFLIPLISILFAVLVITAKNPIVSVLYLIILFSSVSIYLMCIKLYFIGLSYILVYVGAISILFLFILMLINVRVSELVTENKNSIMLAIMGILFISFTLGNILPYTSSIIDRTQRMASNFKNKIYNISSSQESDFDINILEYPSRIIDKFWDGNLIENSHITSIGNILYTDLFIQIIIVSFVLLLAMVGAIIITVKKDNF